MNDEDEAFLILLRLAQIEDFKEEISNIQQSGANNILRVGGRLKNSNLKFDHELTDLLIRKIHLENLHVGTQNLLSIIRLQFWPVNGKNAVKRIVKSCIRCYRANPKPGKFLMGSLPSSRVTPSRPFANCGVDYAGPIFVKEGTLRKSKLVKTYICIFICSATRAIHIELVMDLTTDSFLNALKRFCSRRGKATNIHSDNGLNFVGANNHFLELHKLVNNKEHNDKVYSFLAEDKINWHFLPARSPHMGGLWEAAVKSTKFHLRRVLGESSLNYDEMYTLLVQIESCLNSRPLTAISNDVYDYTPLTPSHFLIGDSLVSPPQLDVKNENISRLSRYHRLQQLYQQFWQRWSKEYLGSLQLRSKWQRDSADSVRPGALVVLVEDNVPPLRWPMARVTEVHSGSDGIVRVLSVRLPNGTILKRSVARVCFLPVENILFNGGGMFGFVKDSATRLTVRT
ncbi:uncharacterized protein LOC132698090 [Cylas formicarius]|uniref:uncharacterized protein LOC132698090 n=1 Tax=Cylas formicarius TaxID=197179 RepID=UPI0029586137|nr:uncharacterized protein LOC132698090 [Cylas formicarius]